MCVIPVVFIANKVFSQIDSAEIPVLGKRVLRRCLPAYDSMDIAYEALEYRLARLILGPCLSEQRVYQIENGMDEGNVKTSDDFETEGHRWVN